MLILPVKYSLVPQWCSFQATDLDLITSNPVFGFHEIAIWVASLNSKAEVLLMLEMCGEWLQKLPISCFCCRTSNPIVESWLRRFHASKHAYPEHRNRYCWNSAEWDRICLNAAVRNQERFNSRLPGQNPRKRFRPARYPAQGN